jgi:hypothetical protein
MNAGVVTARLPKEKSRADALEEARVKSIDSHNAQYVTVRIKPEYGTTRRKGGTQMMPDDHSVVSRIDKA